METEVLFRDNEEIEPEVNDRNSVGRGGNVYQGIKAARFVRCDEDIWLPNFDEVKQDATAIKIVRGSPATAGRSAGCASRCSCCDCRGGRRRPHGAATRDHARGHNLLRACVTGSCAAAATLEHSVHDALPLPLLLPLPGRVLLCSWRAPVACPGGMGGWARRAVAWVVKRRARLSLSLFCLRVTSAYPTCIDPAHTRVALVLAG